MSSNQSQHRSIPREKNKYIQVNMLMFRAREAAIWRESRFHRVCRTKGLYAPPEVKGDHIVCRGDSPSQHPALQPPAQAWTIVVVDKHFTGLTDGVAYKALWTSECCVPVIGRTSDRYGKSDLPHTCTTLRRMER